MTIKSVKFSFNWAVPILLLLSTLIIDFNFRVETLTIAIAFLWLGSHLLIEAISYDKPRKIPSGVVLLIGSILVIIFGLNIVELGANDQDYAALGSLALANLVWFIGPK